MPRNGSGQYQLPAGNPVVTGVPISSTVQNTTMTDVANALTTSVATDGQTPMAANLSMGGFKVTNIAAATATSDAMQFGQYKPNLPGLTFDWPGIIQPAGSLAVPTTQTNLLRATYPNLFAAIIAQITGTIVSGSTGISAVSSTAGLAVGYPISGPGIPAGATIAAIGSGTITLSAAATITTSGAAIIVAPWGLGDGTTTFGMPWIAPDLPVIQANGNVGTTTTGTVKSHLHAVSITSQTENAVHSHAITDPGHAHIEQGGQTGAQGGSNVGAVNPNANVNTSSSTATAFTGLTLGNESTTHAHDVIGNTASTGGTNNLAAGVRMMKCIWY